MSQREEKVLSLHTHGYNCAQALICSYQDILPFEEKELFKLTEGLGRAEDVSTDAESHGASLYSYFNCYDLFLFENM